MDLSQVGDWCAADPRLYLSSTDPLRISFFEADGTAIPTTVVVDGRFLRLASRVDLEPETLALVKDPDVRKGLDDYLLSVVRGRSSLSHVLLSPDASCVDIEVGVFDDGLNGHTFLVAVQEIFNLRQIVTPALAGLALSISSLRESRAEITLADEARRKAEQDLERLQQETVRGDTDAINRAESLKQEVVSTPPPPPIAPVTPKCRSCSSELQPGARFCIVCGTPVAA
jgi:hypothetical protein